MPKLICQIIFYVIQHPKCENKDGQSYSDKHVHQKCSILVRCGFNIVLSAQVFTKRYHVSFTEENRVNEIQLLLLHKSLTWPLWIIGHNYPCTDVGLLIVGAMQHFSCQSWCIILRWAKLLICMKITSSHSSPATATVSVSQFVWMWASCRGQPPPSRCYWGAEIFLGSH